MANQHDGHPDPADDGDADRTGEHVWDRVVGPAAAPEAEPGTTAGLSGPSYRPPPSPAYAPPTSGGLTRGRGGASTGVEREDGPASPGAASPAADTRHRLGWQLLAAGLAFVVVAALVVVVAVTSGGDGGPHAFGEVRTVAGDVVARSATDAAPRDLEQGETVVAGWVVDAPDDASVAIDLAGGGVARVDSGARLRFVDLAVDPDTGDRARDSEPAIDVSGGRLWLVPGDDPPASPVKARIGDAVVETAGNPVAIDCTAACSVEAPAGGVTLTTVTGIEVAPTTAEVVTVSGPDSLDLALGDDVSDWARQNLDADAKAGLPEPEYDGGPGIVGSAILDGDYSVAVTVVGPPAGDPIPAVLQYPEGETYAVELSADGGDCEPGACSARIVSADGTSGTAEVGDGEVTLALELPIDCYDQSHTRVVRPAIGTTTVEATVAVESVEFDGVNWLVRRFRGSGTVAATLATPCNPGDVLGTSTSPISVAGS